MMGENDPQYFVVLLDDEKGSPGALPQQAVSLQTSESKGTQHG
jgi:hypothetical protein